MKKIIIILLISISSMSYGQENKKRAEVFGETALVQFNSTLFTIDAKYRLTKQISISSWNRTSLGQDISLGGDFFSSISTVNYKLKTKDVTFSAGYLYFSNQFSNIGGTVIKIRFKII